MTFLRPTGRILRMDPEPSSWTDGSPFRLAVAAIGCLVLAGCGTSSTPSAVTTHDPGEMSCPTGKPAQGGTPRYGANIGTWETIHHKVPDISEYTGSYLSGYFVIRCSTDLHVISEEEFLAPPQTREDALRIGVAELPADVHQVYQHTYPECVNYQYRSHQLAQVLGGDDVDGRVNVLLENYAGDAVGLVLIYMGEKLGQDTLKCD